MSRDEWMELNARILRELEDHARSGHTKGLETWISIRTIHALEDLERQLDGIREQLAIIAARIERSGS